MQKADVVIPQNAKKLSKDSLLHLEYYVVECERYYELFRNGFLNKNSEQITNLNGTLLPDVPQCVEKRCDTEDLENLLVFYKTGTRAEGLVESRTDVYYQCPDKFEFRNGRQTVEGVCLKGIFKANNRNRLPRCSPKNCPFTGYPDSQATLHKILGFSHRTIIAGDIIAHRETLDVSCQNGYELYVNSTDTFLDEFSSTCEYGDFGRPKEQFPACIEERCEFNPFRGVCWKLTDGRCKGDKFKVSSNSDVVMECANDYTLIKDNTPQTTRSTTLRCSKGTYETNFKCVPDDFLTRAGIAAEWVLKELSDVLESVSCKFSFWFTGSCYDDCFIQNIDFGFASADDGHTKIIGMAKHLAEIRYFCYDGYQLKGLDISRECRNGVWDVEDTVSCSPIEPVWTDWSSWSTCDVTCGEGVQTRSRTCDQESTCEGDSTESQVCGTEICPAWTNWSEWSECSASCNGGVMSRYRNCNKKDFNLKDIWCAGPPFEMMGCNQQRCERKVAAFSSAEPRRLDSGILAFSQVHVLEGFDHNSSTGALRIKYPGVYMFIATVIEGGTSANKVDCLIQNKGSQTFSPIKQLNGKDRTGRRTTHGYGSATAAVVLRLSEGDEISVYCQQSTGSSLTHSSFSAALISEN